MLELMERLTVGLGGLVEADPVIVGLVVVAVCVAAVSYVVARLRARRREG